ncbi:metallophosphoesterase family protein [Actinotalea caeni]|uniref:metallophosphoesterase family protein n=1 Tax=Actinotalea caeni TaxID=1348467 RepID=UPI001390E7BB|nr:metallophosphoesterase [Actinotalea caeni]
MRILQLTDTHVGGQGGGGDPALAALDRLLSDLADVEDLDLVLVTGDVADDPAGFPLVRERVGDFAAARGLPQVYLPGNGDDPGAFRDHLGSGHLDPSGADTAPRTGPRGAAVAWHDGVRLVTLDSTVPGQMHGLLGDATLAWLRELLSTPAPAGTVLAMHHPPLAVPDSAFLTDVALRDASALADAIEGTDVRAVLTGHFHLQAAGQCGGVPVWVSPAVESRVDLAAPRGTLRFLEDPGASVVTLPAVGPPTFHTLHARGDSRELRSAVVG